MEESRHFYLTLPSDEGGLEFQATNTNASYKIRLPHPIHLDEQDWEVAMVSVSFPLRNHQEYMLSHFWPGSTVAMMGARPWYRSPLGVLDASGIRGKVTMADIVDPYLPPKGGRQFMEHLIFALEKSVQKRAIEGMSEFFTPKARDVRWGSYTDKNDFTNVHQSKQRFTWTNHGTLRIEGDKTEQLDGNEIVVAFESRLAEFIGLIEPGSVAYADRKVAKVGRRVHYYEPGNLNVPHELDVLDKYWTLETVWSGNDPTYWILFGNAVDWEIFGLDDGWYEQHMTHRNHVVHVSSNICDRSVTGSSHTSLLGTAKINAVQDGQTYYEPVHLRYPPVRQYVLDVVEIQLTEAKRLMNLGAGTTTVVLHFRPAIKGGTEEEKEA